MGKDVWRFFAQAVNNVAILPIRTLFFLPVLSLLLATGLLLLASGTQPSETVAFSNRALLATVTPQAFIGTTDAAYLPVILRGRSPVGFPTATPLASATVSPTSTPFPSPVASPSPTHTPDPRPNFLIIVSDDQRFDTMDYMPRTQARLFNEGISFSNAHVTTPVCCPSRASILTGMYDHNHGVYTNPSPLLYPTFMERLDEAGYYTGLVGKYLNSWDGEPRPEYDYWVSHLGGNISYTSPYLNVNGSWVRHYEYATYVFRDYATQFLEDAVQHDEPFALLITPNAPHEPAIPAPGDESLYQDLSPFRPPSFNEADISDKSVLAQTQPPLLQEPGIAEIDEFRLLQLQTLNSLDEAVDSLLTTLSAQGELDNTVVVYLSDNGYFWGEHRLLNKFWPYEEALRVPFAIRYPPLVPAGRVDEHLVANIDIAPTLYELAGVPLPPEVDGRSLVPLIENPALDWREEIIIEAATDIFDVGWLGVRTERYVYVETENEAVPELYDLEVDPYQLENVVEEPAYAAIRATLAARVAEVRAESGSVVRIIGPLRVDTAEPTLFEAELYPTATEPLTYSWYVDDNPVITQSGTLTSSVTLTWPTDGFKSISVTATGEDGTLTGNRIVNVLDNTFLLQVGKSVHLNALWRGLVGEVFPDSEKSPRMSYPLDR